TFESLLRTFVDFLVVAIHTILHDRALYPHTTFIRTRIYNHEVWQNRHPHVCKWILHASSAVQKQLYTSNVSRIDLIIFQEDGYLVERWWFDVANFPVIPWGEALTNLVDIGGHDLNLVDIEEQLRGTLTKLQAHGKKLEPLPENCTYTLAMKLKDEA
ncbi:DNA-binding protein, partial [Bisporella sp. PMI_857]